MRVLDAILGSVDMFLYVFSGALGAGLVIFSRFPFIRTSIFPYSLNGEPIDVGAGDWFVGKAAASITIIHPLLGQVEIFNTHVGRHPVLSNLSNTWTPIRSCLQKEVTMYIA